MQHVTQAASEGLNAKFSDLCDPHDLSSVRASKRTISKQSRASSKAHRQLRNQERRLSAAADDDAFLMAFLPVKTEPSLFRLRRSISLSSVGLHSSGKPGQRVTKRLLRLCMGSGANKYTPLPVY